MRINRKFFDRPTIIVARQLLGKYLCRRINGKILRARITETEAYCGPRDLASHASRGLTNRTKVMFGPPGRAYIYLIYGMYYCLNVVTEREGYPAAVLVRGVEIIDGLPPGDKAVLRGPGKLCRTFQIDKKLNDINLCNNGELWIESTSRQRVEELLKRIKRGKRVGVDYAGPYKNKLWRFYLD